MTAWAVLTQNSNAPADSIAWLHLNNQVPSELVLFGQLEVQLMADLEAVVESDLIAVLEPELMAELDQELIAEVT